MHALHAKGLIGDFITDQHNATEKIVVPYLRVSPTSLGIQLYAIACNRLEDWRSFAVKNFGKFDSVDSLRYLGKDMESLLKSLPAMPVVSNKE
jgi:hypothetical protein